MTFLLALSLLWQGDAERHFAQAVELHQTGKLDQAVSEYQAYLKERPDNFMARSNLGAALSKLGRYPEAIEQYKLALERRDMPPVRMNLALAYYKSSQWKPAIDELNKLPSSEQVDSLLSDALHRRVMELIARPAQ